MEAILLSRCYAFFGSPWSSFTELAIRLGAHNPKISGEHFARRKFAAFCHRHSVNLGDTIQTLAVTQFIPARTDVKAAGEPDGYVERDAPSLGLFDAHGVLISSRAQVRSPYGIVHNGWFDGRLTESEPFPEQLSPLVLSMHLNESALLLRDPKYTDLLAQHGVSGRSLMEHRKGWFREHAPIGCRDQHTMDLLAAQNIRSFVSGCATLLLRRPADVVRTNRVLIVDTHILFPSLLALNQVPTDAERASMVRRPGLTCAQKLQEARAMLARFASAKCVVTSRLHAALPSLAMDVPVLFLFNPTELMEDVRFDKRMRTILGLDETGHQASPWNWEAPSITETQREAITEVQTGLRWRLEHFYSIGT